MTPTYAEFLAAFVVLPIAVLWVLGNGLAPERRKTATVGIALMVSVAMAYTTPWDNYLVATRVWWYPDWAVTVTLIEAPVEEYLFILLQPVLAALWLYRVGMPAPADVPRSAGRARPLGAAALLAVAGWGGLLLTGEPGFYLGAILAWAAPVLALQWAVGGHYLVGAWRTVAVAVGVPTLYLWVADRLAIEWGIWVISDRYTTGVDLLGLPIEEATFFVVTNLLVVQGLVLFHWVVEDDSVRAYVARRVPRREAVPGWR